MRLTADILLIDLNIFLLLTLLARNSFSLSPEIPLLTSSEQDDLLTFGLMGQPQIPNRLNLRTNQFGRIRELFQIIWQTIFMDEFVGIYQQPLGDMSMLIGGLMYYLLDGILLPGELQGAVGRKGESSERILFHLSLLALMSTDLVTLIVGIYHWV
ncbi:hypothetical protein PAXRUDRAFT_16169 [Paxillus rubicundulus Ve08.2h10]|uniref:Uncharacterized protein n=1 Tax=Paxillus rubicundulus Ve08.2h10 TaxID=930991 RepID=A0A0D0DFB0_9AGAM|nr:hypothetical protein PAXRUDRAFT_16169 [Paxillus rubicundulus Ve08.2h10]